MITDKIIRHNIVAHNKFAQSYEQMHDEIFNPVEQDRLGHALSRAVEAISTDSISKRVLDFGCGDGNLTRHLLDLQVHVVSADVASNFLELIEKKFGSGGRSETLLLNGTDLSNIGDQTFDMVSTYSVLHHIPDYLSAVQELVRVTKQGGIIYLDHEQNDESWNPTGEYQSFIQNAKKNRLHRQKIRKPWFTRQVRKVRRLFNPRYQSEGDIHVWPDDHIEWDRIESIFKEMNCEVVMKEDFLLYKARYPHELYDDYKEKCTDYRVMAVRRC